MIIPAPTPLQRWVHRRWGVLRIVIPLTSALAIAFAVWFLIANQPGQVIGLLISGAVIGATFFSFRGTVRYVDKYDQTR